MNIVDKIASQIIVNREINREGEFAFRSHQRSMSSTKHTLEDVRQSMIESETYTSTEILEPLYRGNPKEVRKIVLNDKGIFQKIDCVSGVSSEQVYNILLIDPSFWLPR